MDKDIASTDVMVYSVSEITDAKGFRSAVRETVPQGGEAAKVAVARAVEARFEHYHDRASQIRTGILATLAQRGIEPTTISLPRPD